MTASVVLGILQEKCSGKVRLGPGTGSAGVGRGAEAELGPRSPARSPLGLVSDGEQGDSTKHCDESCGSSSATSPGRVTCPTGPAPMHMLLGTWQQLLPTWATPCHCNPGSVRYCGGGMQCTAGLDAVVAGNGGPADSAGGGAIVVLVCILPISQSVVGRHASCALTLIL
jgi:hypothetical protein